jgi:hypothetical protein
MTTINHEVNEMIKEEDDIYNVIVDLAFLLKHYVSYQANIRHGHNDSTRTQALATIKQANQILQKMRKPT